MILMEDPDIESADLVTLGRMLKECQRRMDQLKAEYQREQKRAERIAALVHESVRGTVMDKAEARRIEANMLKAASLIISKRHDAKQERHIAKADAMQHAMDVALKNGYRAVPPEI